MAFEKTIIISEPLGEPKRFRFACRGVVIDENGQIPLLFDSYKKWYKLPGGGMEGDEDKIETLRREIREETGCEIIDIKEVGKVIEKDFDWEQVSYCFIGKIVSKGEAHFTQKEIERGYQLKWVSLEDALSLIKNEEANTDEAKFRKERELFIIEKCISELS